jgi:site-specific DNA-methyltransferase (adenine-specific)/site-specific DNA-methyltransferase (cytosine-N4-specific)
MHLKENNLYYGNAFDLIRRVADASIDLIVTSPPYADQRKATYGGVDADRYVEWFLPLSAELHRVLKPTGSFVLNIKERTVEGERHTYVLELIMAMRQQGWLWTEEYCWHKRNCAPGKWPNRFRDAWERCLHFTKQRKFAMYQDSVKVPIGDWSKSRLKKLSDKDRTRQESAVGSGFGKNIENWVGKELVFPTNVLHFATECGNKGHSAAFPEQLPEFFIKLFTEPGDHVLDPFLGSGTTAAVAKRLGRAYYGFETNAEYFTLADKRVHDISAAPNAGAIDAEVLGIAEGAEGVAPAEDLLTGAIDRDAPDQPVLAATEPGAAALLN